MNIFLMIHAERGKNKEKFIQRAQRLQGTWNFFRPHNGKGMNGRTPFEKFKGSKTLVSSHVFQFPTLLLEDILKKVGIFYSLFCNKLGGKYVFNTCQTRYSERGARFFEISKELDNAHFERLCKRLKINIVRRR